MESPSAMTSTGGHRHWRFSSPDVTATVDSLHQRLTGDWLSWLLTPEYLRKLYISATALTYALRCSSPNKNRLKQGDIPSGNAYVIPRGDCMHVRRGDAHDWPFIYSLAREAIPYSLSPWRKQPLEETMKYREQLLKGFWGWIKQTGSQVFIAETESEVKIGYLVLYPSSREELTGMFQAWVMDVAVSPKWRGRGAGKALFGAAEEYCRENKISYLGLAVSSHNVRALSMYESIGFAEERKLMVKVIKKEEK